MKFFIPLTQTLALAAFKRASADGMPMLNETEGAVAYTDYADCIKASIELSEAAEVTTPMASVIHIEYPDDSYNLLLADGQVSQSSNYDSLDKPLLLFSAAACTAINSGAFFTASFHKLNPFIGGNA